MRGWTVQDSANLYGIPQWGAGFFDVNDAGNVVVKAPGRAPIDLSRLVDDLVSSGHRTPLLLRFSDVLDQRIEDISGAFRTAIADYGYGGRYRAVYPIKVNQQRHVVESVVSLGARNHVGLEAGSKPELLVALAHTDSTGPIVCNGYKDRAYIETALLAQRLGRRPILVIDRYSELELVIRSSRELGIRPHLGVRGRLTARGAGRWVESTGNRSKFGLSATELVRAVERLREQEMLDCLELVHVHIGSQITAIQAHKEALREVSRIYVGLRDLGATHLDKIDVGGGLGVDYDGSRTNFHSSMNYSVQEYANDVVWAVMDACDDAGHPHPEILSESGRALVAHHVALVFDVLGVNAMKGAEQPLPVKDDDPRVLRDLEEAGQHVTRKNAQESYHDALQKREEALTLFALGFLDLEQRARVEQLFLACLERVHRVVSDMDYVPEDLAGLERALADTYYGNFSLFQSAPDHWAVRQLFPVLPIHRLGERPTRRGVIADLTCDSDGKIDKFIDAHDVKDVLELHPLNGKPYYLGVFLVGAYQEILGDLHNLFGDTNAVHVRATEGGGYEIEHVVDGDKISDVLRYVQYSDKELLERMGALIDEARRSGRLEAGDSKRLWEHFTRTLREYTYLSGD